MASIHTYTPCRCLANYSDSKTRWPVRVSGSSGYAYRDLILRSSGSDEKKEEKWRSYLVDAQVENLKLTTRRKWVEDKASNDFEPLWNDGYGEMTVNDYLDRAREIIKPDGGPPRWFCPVECGEPIKGSPLLLFLPGMDGIGLGLIMHHKALGKVFEVRCLHIPVRDRTSFQGLLKVVEETVRLENSANPNKPIYLVGDSFGACIALAVAARNPEVDLVLILANPATSFDRSQLQPIIPALSILSNELVATIPYLLSFTMGNPLKLAAVKVDKELPSAKQFDQLSSNLLAMLPQLSMISDIIPRETLLWKVQLIKSAAAYANSRLHAVTAEVLILASGNDGMLPSGDEAQRLKRSLRNCTVRYFKDNGHTLLLEDNLSLLTIIKGMSKYRQSLKLDYALDFTPPSLEEFKRAFDEVRLLMLSSSSAMFSTLENGKIVRGLSGVPDEGPVLLVGYHMLMGFELYSIVEQFLSEKNVILRSLAHPVLFPNGSGEQLSEFSVPDWMKVMGAVPVSGLNLYKLLASRSHVLLYPGGAREALHYKGEEYKLFWPDQPEFIRMAAKFGATIVPFGAVGEDDLVNYAMDFHDLEKVPGYTDFVRQMNQNVAPVRNQSPGDVGNPELYLPFLLPKLPGRVYCLFGKPRRIAEDMLHSKEAVNDVYLQIKSEVESNMAYLVKKREEDPYRNLIARAVYRAMNSSLEEVPSFEP